MFRDEELGRRTIERLEALTEVPLAGFLETALEGNPDPDRAVLNLERWFGVVSSPAMYADILNSAPGLGRLLLLVLGASQPLADSITQNPEFAALFLEPALLRQVPGPHGIEAEGKRLLLSATSPSHALDRLRFLKQKTTLPIVLNDLAAAWPQPVVWRALSDLADTIIRLARWELWRKIDPSSECPLTVVAFGKLGGHEVNYSSDVDLAYVIPDDADEKLERETTRFAEQFGRALAQRMGRGALYRVDLRLRPYGGTGPILRRMRSYEGYYDLYAEPWEIQALLRSRPITGPPEVMARWDAMRQSRCFRPRLGENALREMLAMRTRIEEFSEADDIKRGKGGIRDVEFAVQILQMAYGYGHPELQVLPTLPAIEALITHGALTSSVGVSLSEAYTFLRRLEHRLQLLGDQQTHTIPADPRACDTVARMLGLADGEALRRETTAWRRTVAGLYEAILHPEAISGDAREKTLRSLGPLAPSAERWFDALPASEAFWAALSDNPDSLANVRRVLETSPVLVDFLKERVGVTERILSGEIQEPGDLYLPLDKRAGRDAAAFARAYVRGWLGSIVRWQFVGGDLGSDLAAGMDRLLRLAVAREGDGLAVFALGSWGNQHPGPGSDADLLLLADGVPQSEAELRAQSLIAFLNTVRRAGAPFSFDLRLRPDGGKGLLARSPEGLAAYDREGIDLWERFALGHARQVTGDPSLLQTVLTAAHRLPLSAEGADELLTMKHRIETERVSPHHIHRDPKLGAGGIADIEWTVRIGEFLYGADPQRHRLIDRAQALWEKGGLTSEDLRRIGEALPWMLEIRDQLWLLGHDPGLIPENPDRLARLAQTMGCESANAFLSRYRGVTEGVRDLWLRMADKAKR
ncbi:hypothetical protein BH11ARM2_BH11ARM2_30970 [soil metagenome]